MANYVIKNERGDAVVREDEIYDWFIAKDNAALCDTQANLRVRPQSDSATSSTTPALRERAGNDGKPSLAMDSLKRLAGGAFSLHYVLLLAAANFPKPLFDHFVAQLESFLFYYIFTKTPTKDLERSFSQWADELRADCGDKRSSEAEGSAQHLRRRPLREKNMAASRRSSPMPSALHAVFDAAVPHALLAGAADQHVEMAFSGLKVQAVWSHSPLEIEHILPNNPKAELRAQVGSREPNAAPRRLQESPRQSDLAGEADQHRRGK